MGVPRQDQGINLSKYWLLYVFEKPPPNIYDYGFFFVFRYTFPAFTLCWTEFLELLVRVPCNTMGYIEANYGPNWFTPITKWSWKSSPSNVKRNGVWPKEEWSKVINIA